MTAAELAHIYERHIKALPREGRLQLVALIARELAEEDASTAEEPRRSILELRGLGKEIWNGVDGQEYVNRLRDEWDERPS
jgi:hypothetical protein